ncbi:MAG TPA: NAD(P)H-hydrate epimerase, partial [Anaerolineae bacterium]|nr:NAD(P)H-hydrate epimerase [Anaerolineae bacterium]
MGVPREVNCRTCGRLWSPLSRLAEVRGEVGEMKVVTTAEMRRIERAADAGGLSYATMMENAGRAVAEAIGQKVEVAGKRILVLVGPGNNGGDGLVAARHLHDAGAKVTLYIWKRRVEGDENFRLTQERGIPTTWAEKDAGLAALGELLEGAEVVVDALLGTGISRPIEGLLKGILEITKRKIGKEIIEERPLLLSPSFPSFPSAPSFPFVVAVDVPTGLNCDTGAIDPAAVPADLTVTFGFPKRGQFLFPGAEYVGQLLVADIGIPPELAEDVRLEVTTPEMARELLPRRPLGAHKGTFGRALVVAGSPNYIGAAYLASAAATRVGTGLVTLALAESIHPILAAKLSEVTFLLLPHDLGALTPDAVEVLSERIPHYRALLLGPGLGREKATVEFVQRLLGIEPAARPRMGFLRVGEEVEGRLTLPPLVIDADGLNALADTPRWWERLSSGNVLTPHPGEMSRLTGRSIADIQADRIGAAQEAAREWGQVVILKGAYTVI